MNLLFIIFLVCPISFSQSPFEEGIDSYEAQVESIPLEVEEFEFDQEHEFSYGDPLLELGGSERINYAQDYIVEEDINSDFLDESN
jgi:hypothetical protein